MPKNAKTPVEEDKNLQEFAGSDHENTTADPVIHGSASRSADRSGGMIDIPDFATKAEVLQQIIGTIHTQSKQQLQDIYKGLHAPVDPGRAADKGQDHGEREPIYLSPTSVRPHHEGDLGYGNPNHSSVTRPGPEQTAGAMRISPSAVVAKEDIDEIFGEDLSEELKEKTRIIFEASVNTRLFAEIARLEEENEAFLEETVEDIRQELTENANEYLTYIAEQWVKENEVEIDGAIKVEMAETFLASLKELFENNYVNVQEDKVDVVAEMQARLEEAEKKVNELTSELLTARESVEEGEVRDAFNEAVAGLNEFQRDKLATLAEGVAWENPAEFVSKLTVLKETYMSDKPAKGQDILTEENGVDGEVRAPAVGAMKAYLEVADQVSKNAK